MNVLCGVYMCVCVCVKFFRYAANAWLNVGKLEFMLTAQAKPALMEVDDNGTNLLHHATACP